MRILHVGVTNGTPNIVNGVNSAVWQLTANQARQGHDVGLLLHDPLVAEGLSWAEQTGLQLHFVPGNAWELDAQSLEALLYRFNPQIVHMHSAFLPYQAALAKRVARNRMPYVITPHGGLGHIHRRSRFRKAIYSWLVERRRFRAAAAITVLTAAELQQLRDYIPDYQGLVREIPNSVDTGRLGGVSWSQHDGTRPRLAFLGRFDVLNKGLDILIEIARHLPETEFHLYGTPHSGTEKWLKQLQKTATANVWFHEPVFGIEKAATLAGLTMYIQTSRWEGFGISIAEAMYVGTPCAISATIGLAPQFREHDLGLLLPPRPPDAARVLREVLADGQRLAAWSSRARRFAEDNFDPVSVTRRYLDVYDEVCANVTGASPTGCPMFSDTTETCWPTGTPWPG